MNAPSSWIVRWASLIAPRGRILDVAAGSGRHARWLARHGFAVTAVDRDAAVMATLEGVATPLVADIETGPWPFAGQTFDGVVVTNYLFRPLLPSIVDAVGSGGLLLYETFAAGNASVGRPANPDFLLAPGELLSAAAGLRIVAYEDGFLEAPERFVQRIAAVRERSGKTTARYPLAPREGPADR